MGAKRLELRCEDEVTFVVAAAAANLANWSQFESDNPEIFAAMYQFWVQRSDGMAPLP